MLQYVYYLLCIILKKVKIMAYRVFFVRKVDHPAFLNNFGTTSLGVFHRLDDSHQRDIVALSGAAIINSSSTMYYM